MLELNEKEVKALLIGLGMFQLHLKQETEELVALAKERKAKEPKEPTFCCFQHEEKKVEDTFKDDLILCANLRDKLKMHQMKFPCEEHKYKQYTYGEKFGYENAKWVQETPGSGITPGTGKFIR